jgi:hypothetical protein
MCLQDAAHTAVAAYTHIPTLKEGEKIKIAIGGRGKHSTTHDANNSVPTSVATASNTGTGPSKGFGGLLRPPPPAGSVVQYQGGKPDHASLISLQYEGSDKAGADGRAEASVGATSGGTAGGTADEEWGDFA